MIRGTTPPFDVPVDSIGVIIPDEFFCTCVLTSPSTGLVRRGCFDAGSLLFLGEDVTDPDAAYRVSNTATPAQEIWPHRLRDLSKFFLRSPETVALSEYPIVDPGPFDVGEELVMVGYGESADPSRFPSIQPYGIRGFGTGVVKTVREDGTLILEESRGTEISALADTGGVWYRSTDLGVTLVGLTTKVTTTSGELPKRYIYVTPAYVVTAHDFGTERIVPRRSTSGAVPVAAALILIAGIALLAAAD